MSVNTKLDFGSSSSSCIFKCGASILARSTMFGGMLVISVVVLVASYGYFTNAFSGTACR
jgi:hypothetical protein